MEQSKFPCLFITLTYSDKHLPRTLDEHPELRKHYGDTLDQVTLKIRDVQLFTKLLRKENAKHTTHQYRYYLAGEYGSKYGRPHYHIIAFNLHPRTMHKLPSIWKRGIIDVSECRSTKNVSNYVAGYIVNAYSASLRINKRPFATMSKKPYLGHTYVTRMYTFHKQNQTAYLERGKHKMALPRIFKNKIFEQWELNAMKQPAVVQNALHLEAELANLTRLYGPEYDAINSYYKTRIHHEQQIKLKAKHTDKYEYHLGSPQTPNPFSPSTLRDKLATSGKDKISKTT